LIINPHDDLQASNVLSKKYEFHYDEWEVYLRYFLEEVNLMGVTLKGPLFYCLNNVPLEKAVSVEFFVSIEEDWPKTTAGMDFRSYFGIDSMISICLYNDIQTRTEEAYARLLYYIQTNLLQQTTPIFHVVSGDHEFPYTYIKIGVSNKDNEQVWK